jgi:hypothetical protein
MCRRPIFRVFVCILLWWLPLAAKEPEPDYTQPYLLLEVPLRRLEKELNSAGRHGYRVLDMAPVRLIAGTKSSKAEKTADIVGTVLTSMGGAPQFPSSRRHWAWGAGVLLERVGSGSLGEAWQYRVSTACHASGIRKAARKAAGYRLLPYAAIRVRRTFESLHDDCVLLMEQPPHPAKRYEYEVVTSRSGAHHLDRALAEAAQQGFKTLLVMPPEHGELGTFLEERISPAASEAPQPYAPHAGTTPNAECAWVSGRNTAEAEQKLNSLGLKGYHVLDTERPRKEPGWRFLMEKASGETKSYKYKLATAQRASELGGKLNAAGREGYQLVRNHITSFRLFKSKQKFSPFMILLEKQQPAKPQIECVVIAAAAAQPSFLYDAIARAEAQKYSVMEFWQRGNECIVIAERRAVEEPK